ncbi:uncharacterized protein AB9X84_014809 isoform 2-T2 [Acanthopagrus schlegelii]
MSVTHPNSIKEQTQKQHRPAGRVHEWAEREFMFRRRAAVCRYPFIPHLQPLRSDMAPLWMLVFGIYILCVSGKLVNLNDTVQLTVNGSCAAADMQLVRVQRTGHNTRTLARLVGGVWQPTEDYKDRVHHVSASSVNLTWINFNDDAFYEFTCKTDLITIIDVTVVFPYDVRVSEGETARIPCFSSTERIQGVRWERDGELILVQNRSSGQPEGRLSVSPVWVQTGDLSLTVEDAQLEDGGSYICYTVDGHGEKTRGKPDAVKFVVQHFGIFQQIGPGLIACIIVIVLLFFICILLGVYVWKTRRAGGVRTSGGGHKSHDSIPVESELHALTGVEVELESSHVTQVNFESHELTQVNFESHELTQVNFELHDLTQ